jgi:hypothetical protein
VFEGNIPLTHYVITRLNSSEFALYNAVRVGNIAMILYIHSHDGKISHYSKNSRDRILLDYALEHNQLNAFILLYHLTFNRLYVRLFENYYNWELKLDVMQYIKSNHVTFIVTTETLHNNAIHCHVAALHFIKIHSPSTYLFIHPYLEKSLYVLSN